MANVHSDKLIRIYGVTLAGDGNRLRPYGHGAETINGQRLEYVDYFIDDLIEIIKHSKLDGRIIKELNKQQTLL